MKKTFVAAALLAGMVGPVSAATVLDFTADDNDATSGSFNGIGWKVTSDPEDSLVNARHWNANNCGPYTCFDTNDVGQDYDVGFGISSEFGPNGEEIDEGKEAVVVTFTNFVKISGFAGMLAYLGVKGGEAVQLEYSTDFGASWLGLGDYIATATEAIGSNFDTVGLAFRGNLGLVANAVRFTATGIVDDTNVNVTAAALHIAPVPVPASFPLLLAGIGALGFAARRKRKSA